MILKNQLYYITYTGTIFVKEIVNTSAVKKKNNNNLIITINN